MLVVGPSQVFVVISILSDLCNTKIPLFVCTLGYDACSDPLYLPFNGNFAAVIGDRSGFRVVYVCTRGCTLFELERLFG